MKWRFWRREPLECSECNGYLLFSRTLTADETALLRSAWDAAYKGLVRPDTGWPPLPMPLPPPPKGPPQPTAETELLAATGAALCAAERLRQAFDAIRLGDQLVDAIVDKDQQRHGQIEDVSGTVYPRQD